MEIYLLNLAPGEPIALVKKLPYFEKLVELYVLLVSILCFGVHDIIHYKLLNELRIEFYGHQLLCWL